MKGDRLSSANIPRPPNGVRWRVSVRVGGLMALAIIVTIVGVLLVIRGASFTTPIPDTWDYINLFAGGGLLLGGILVLVLVLRSWFPARVGPVASLLLLPIGLFVIVWSLGLISTARQHERKVVANSMAARALEKLQYDIGSYTFAGKNRAGKWQEIYDTNRSQLRALQQTLPDDAVEVHKCIVTIDGRLNTYHDLIEERVFVGPGMSDDVERAVREARSELLTKIHATIANFRSDLTQSSVSVAKQWQLLSLIALSSGVFLLALSVIGYSQLRESKRRRSAEQRLHGQERRLRMMLEQLPAIVWTTDRELRFTSSDGAGLASLSLKPGEVVGKTLYDFFQTQDKGFRPIAEHLRALRGELTDYEQEWEGQRFMTYVGPMRDERGKIAGAIGAAWDVTEQRQAETALRQKERLAALGTMAAGIAHEINNPLWMISLQTEAATVALRRATNDGKEADSEVAEYLRNIQELVLRGGKIVSNILKFAGRTSGEQTAGQLVEPIQGAVDLSRKKAQQVGISIRWDSPGELPAVRFNSTEIEQVFVNLINNAIDASNEGEEEVLVSCEADDQQIVVTVEDFGVGMTEEALRQMFDPFFTTRRSDGGTGLGLAICERIIKDHHGRIQATSRLGAGTRVTVTLPVLSVPSYANSGR